MEGKTEGGDERMGVAAFCRYPMGMSIRSNGTISLELFLRRESIGPLAATPAFHQHEILHSYLPI